MKLQDLSYCEASRLVILWSFKTSHIVKLQDLSYCEASRLVILWSFNYLCLIFTCKFCWDDSVTRRYSLKRGVCFTGQSSIGPLLVYEYIILQCLKVILVDVGPLFSLLFGRGRNLVIRHISQFSREKSAIYSSFLLKKNLLFTSLPIWVFMFPPIIRTLSLVMYRIREDSSLKRWWYLFYYWQEIVVALGMQLYKAFSILRWILLMFIFPSHF